MTGSGSLMLLVWCVMCVFQMPPVAAVRFSTLVHRHLFVYSVQHILALLCVELYIWLLERKIMAANISLMGTESSRNSVIYLVVSVQVLVSVFLCINFLLITTFSQEEYFYTTMRYILFAVTLASDSVYLLVTDILFIFNSFYVTIQMWLCLIICFVLTLCTFATPVTLTAMTLERYVAICLPLHHAELCSTRKALHSILIIPCISCVPCIIVLSIFFASATQSFYTSDNKCTMDTFIFYSWQGHLRSALSQFYFLLMCIAIVFSYVKIMKVAKGASGKNKRSSWKGLRTVVLHTFQLLLCLIHLWCPFVEAAVLQINVVLFRNVRYFNYFTFIIAPRCLSPLIYGLRDDRFFLALKYYALCGLYKKQ